MRARVCVVCLFVSRAWSACLACSGFVTSSATQVTTWSRRSGSVTKILPADAKWEQAPSWFWQPIARDRIAEQRLLADIARRLEP